MTRKAYGGSLMAPLAVAPRSTSIFFLNVSWHLLHGYVALLTRLVFSNVQKISW